MADSALTGYPWFKDISHIPKGKCRGNQLWAFKWEREITSASVTTLFLNKRSRSSSLEHLTVALRDNRTMWKSLFWLWNNLHAANSRIHEVTSGTVMVMKVSAAAESSLQNWAALNLVSLLLKSTCWFWGLCSAFPSCSSRLNLMETEPLTSRCFRKEFWCLITHSHLCTQVWFFSPSRSPGLQWSSHRAVLSCSAEKDCVSFCLRKKTRKLFFT